MGLDRETIVTLGSALPPAIGIFGRLEALLKNPDTDLDQIIDLVKVDSALTFQIIRLGNSAFYGLKSRCDSLEDAVARIGFRDIHSLVGLVAARHACQQDLLAYQMPARKFWENTVATSQLMAAFAARNATDGRNAYATGLLRNLGRVVINNYAGAVRYPGVASAKELHAWETKTYNISAADVGATLLEHWRFSPDTVEAVRGHYDPIGSDQAPVSTAMLHLAAAVSDGWGYGFPGEQGAWKHGASIVALAGLDEKKLTEAKAEAQAQFAKIAGIQWANAA